MMARRRRYWAAGAATALVSAGCASGQPEAIIITGDAAASALAEDASGAAMPIGLISYELAANLPALDSGAPAYRATGQGANSDDARRLAAALGLPAPQATPDGGWTAGGTNGTEPSLWVSAGPLGDWWYGASVAVACAEPAAPPDTPVTDDIRCPEPALPQRLPTDEQAIALAGELMAEIGGWTGGSPQVARDDYGVTVMYPTQLGGVATPYSPTVRFSEDSAVESASGYFGTFASAGDYPRIGTDEGFALLQSGQSAPWLPAADLPLAAGSGSGESGGGGSGTDMDEVTAESGEPAPAPEGSDPASEPDPGTEPGSAEPAPATDEPVPPSTTTEPVPVPTEPEPVPTSGADPGAGAVVVRITAVAEGLWSLFGIDDTVWLVPSYVFTSDDGAQYPVLAIPSDLIEIEQPMPLPASGG